MDNILPTISDVMNPNGLPTIDELRRGETPHWFGLGFIQLKLDYVNRMHFWHPDLTADVPDEEVHNHRYSFRSTLVAGALTNEIFSFEPHSGGQYEMVSVSCKKGDGDIWEARGNRKSLAFIPVARGERYYLDRDTFHRTHARFAITRLQRNCDVPFRPRAMVLKQVDGPRVCPFGNDIPVGRLWEYIEDCLAMGSQNDREHKPGYHLREITKGVLGSPSKIIEEAQELLDAHEQGSIIMESVELSDLYGAIRAYMDERHPGLTFRDLEAMANITERAFRNGRR